MSAFAATLALAACDRRSPSPGAPTPSVEATGSTGASTGSARAEPSPATSPASAVTPHSGDLPARPAPNGPAEGATAIGGMSGQQEGGGARKGDAPAPTGGDGAASAPGSARKP